MKNFTEMKKTELRAECKQAGIKNYSKMTNGGMREALVAAHTPEATTDAEEELFEQPQRVETGYTEAGDQAPAADVSYINQFGSAHCPGCGVHLENGVSEHGMDVNGKPLLHDAKQFQCMACGTEFGPEITKAASNAPAGTGVKIEKDRPEQNGVKRPSAGGVCREVWDWCDGFHTENGRSPLPKEAKLVAASYGWNQNNVVCELYQWRKFHGIRGRVKVAATA